MATSDYYVPTKRSSHSTNIVGDFLYMWGGNIDGLPRVHDNEVKQRMTSVIEVFDLPNGRWEQRTTNGKPPLGVWGYATTVITNNIYYFGGYCNHDQCWHNSLNSLTIDSLTWNEPFPTNPSMGPMMKSGCRMISLTFSEVQLILVVGGYGPCPTSLQHGAQYSGYGDVVRTNEHHYYQLSSGQWIVPEMIGEGPPPCSSFTLTSLPNNRGLLFGGCTHNGYDNTVYIAQCTETAVHWEKIRERLPISVKWPQCRLYHGAIIISDLQLMVLGGFNTTSEPYDSWLFNITAKTWTKLTLPELVTKRCGHSLSLWNVSPTTVWVVQFGGFYFGRLDDTTVIELICNDDQWTVGDVMTNLASTEEYQLKLQQKQQQTSVQTSGKYGQLHVTIQSPTCLQPLPLTHHESQEKDREIQHLTQQLEAANKELQSTRQQLIDLTRALQEDIQAKERRLRVLRLQLRRKQIAQGRLQHEHKNSEKLLQQQLQDLEERERQQLHDIQEKERVLCQEQDDIKQGLHQQLKESTTALEQRQHTITSLQQQIQQLQEQSYWVVMKEEIEMTGEVLGKGGWGEVKVAKFRSLRVAAKCLYEVILSPYNISVFTREMEIAARVRHPNLLQFIGATRVGTPIILSELMPTSLRKELEAGPLSYHTVLAISQDIACGLNYLHLFKPDPILHRDISTANILLTHGQFRWRAKVSDYGSANLQPLIGQTVNPGNPVYSAPEASIPREHSPAMDVYSYGVVLIEMMIRRIPVVAERQLHINAIRQPMFKALIQRCLIENQRERTTMSEIIRDLNDTIG